MKKAFIVASISLLCLFVLLSPNASCPASAGFRIAQTRKATEPDAATQRGANLNLLYEAHQWFKLREGVQTTGAPAFYRGVVATAFNDVSKAEKEFQLVFKSAPKSDSRWWHAWLGLDMVAQARRVTLDFKSMRLTLE